jgi:16S rRNA (cytidine1402-2'-O)-methyltransferase
MIDVASAERSERPFTRLLPAFVSEERRVGLVLVPTPLGNLRDITLRALDALRECDVLVAEDTRVARRLLGALGLPAKPLWSYREQNAATVTAGIIERARLENVALVTDAGMPAISDPGRELVRAARAAGVAVEVLPGPSAFICAAVLSGFDLGSFSFDGFVPRTKGDRERRLRAALEGGATSVWYEAPSRIAATLRTLDEIAPTAQVFVARELTKLHEQQVAGTAAEVLAALPDPPRGEIVLVLAGSPPAATAAPSDDEVERQIDRALAAGASVPDVARELSRRGLGSRAELYRRASDRRPGGGR